MSTLDNDDKADANLLQAILEEEAATGRPAGTTPGYGPAPSGLAGHQAQVLIAGESVTCPSCGQDLTEDGSINFPHPTFANLEIIDGKVRVFQMDAGEADTNAVECSSCGQRLNSEGWEW